MILLAGALLGLIAVAVGAYAEHGLRAGAPDDVLDSVMTAVRYNQIHAVVVVAIGLTVLRRASDDAGSPGQASMRSAAWLFVLGTVLFSFSIYLSALLNASALTRVAPLGGLSLMAGWLALGWAAVRSLTARPGG